MAEPQPENWTVPEVKPLGVALATLGMLIAVLLLAGWFYRQRIEPKRQQPVRTFPAPGVETFTHDGAHDPDRLRLPLPADPAVEAAKRQVVAEGLPGWSAAR